MVTEPEGGAGVVPRRDGDALPGDMRLSLPRLGVLVVIVAVALLVGTVQVRRAIAGSGPTAASWSVPYVDVTLTPTYQFQDPQSNPARSIALAFVVAQPDDPCTPSWGAAYTLAEASRDLELDRRIEQLRASGGDVTISFGGQANEELAVACTDQGRLTAAYRTVIEQYDVEVIDLDIENDAIADAASIERRAEAIAAVQQAREDGERDLAVWLTVPVTPSGLTADGVALVEATIDAGVELTGVNLMTMNFGDGQGAGRDMLAATEQALEATATQVAGVYAARGVTLDESQRWARLGATPMIGQNDVGSEVFTLRDAQGLADFALSKGLGRVSTWSLNRDAPCSASFADVVVLSNTCSGVDQDPLAFAGVFTALPGRAPTATQRDAVVVLDQRTLVDDPATNPYPIWRPTAQYPEAYKVVWHGRVYQAKWYNQGVDPSTVVANPWDTPWSLLGPVGPGDTAPALPTVAPGTYPEWNAATLYDKGDQVVVNGLPYRARWSSEGDVPPQMFPIAPDSPWEPLFEVPGEPSTP